MERMWPMNLFEKSGGGGHEGHRGRGSRRDRHHVPCLTPLEGRALMALLSSPAFVAIGNEVQDVVYPSGSLFQYDSAGAHYLGGNVLSAGVAIDPRGGEVQ